MTEKSEFTTTANLRPICCQNRTNSSFDLKKNNRGNKTIPWYSNRGSFSTHNRAFRCLQSPMLNVLKRDPMLGAWQRAGKNTSNKKPMGRALRWGLKLNSWKETERLAANIPFFWPSVRSWTCFFGLLPDFDRALWELTPSKQQAVFLASSEACQDYVTIVGTKVWLKLNHPRTYASKRFETPARFAATLP